VLQGIIFAVVVPVIRVRLRRPNRHLRNHSVHLLSTMEEWGELDGDFHQKRFFDNIVSLFEMDPKDPWAVETLAWWDK
jgi:hypothetical protein